MDAKGKITAELVGTLDDRERGVQHAELGYMMKPPKERILYALDVFRGFNPMMEPGATRTTHLNVVDCPGISLDAMVEFPRTKAENDDNATSYRWTNEIVIKARANDGNIRHEQPDFTQLGVVEYLGPSSAILRPKSGKPIRFGEKGSEEIMEIIDSAVLDDFYRKEEVRKVAGKGALAAAWEATWKVEESTKPKKTSFLKAFSTAFRDHFKD